MNKRMQQIVSDLMGTASRVSACAPTSVSIHKSDRLKMEAMAELVNLGVAIQTGERCDGDVLVFEGAYAARQAGKTASLNLVH